MRSAFAKTVSLPALVLASATAAQAATIDLLPDGNFDFGARNLGPRESSVALQAVSEIRADGSEYRACVLSSFKQGMMSAIPGAAYDAELQAGQGPLEAIDSLRSVIVPRSSYRADAQYIVVSVSPEGDDFVRINGGAPLVEDGARLFIGDVEVPAEHIQYEYSERYNSDRAPEAYTLHITDPATVDRVKDAVAGQEVVQAVVRTVNSDFIVPLTFQGNTDLRDEFEACLTDVGDMEIARGTFPSWGISDMLTANVDDVLALAAMLEDEDALMNPENYQIANVLWTEGMFAVGPHVLQQMMNGEVIETSMGEYNSYNHLTGVMTVSPSMLQFEEHLWNSCSCGIDFKWPDTPAVGIPNIPGTDRPDYIALITSGVGIIDGYNTGGYTPSGDDTSEKNPFVTPIPPTVYLMGTGIGILFRRRLKEAGKDVAQSDMAIRGTFLAGAIAQLGGRKLAEVRDDLVDRVKQKFSNDDSVEQPEVATLEA